MMTFRTEWKVIKAMVPKHQPEIGFIMGNPRLVLSNESMHSQRQGASRFLMAMLSAIVRNTKRCPVGSSNRRIPYSGVSLQSM